MDGLFNPIKTTLKVKSNVEQFETLSLRDGGPDLPNKKPKISVLGVESEGSDILIEPAGSRPATTAQIEPLSPYPSEPETNSV